MPNIGSAPVSLNHQPGLIVQSSSAVRSDPMVELYADPTTHRLLVDAAITIDNLTVSENIAQIGGATITLGQKTMANSLPVTLASDQLPAGAALTDSLANPTTTVIGSMLMGYNSSSWERLRTDLGDGSVSTGLQNIVPMLYNGTTYDRLPGSTIGLQVKGGYTELSGLTAGALSADLVPSTDVSSYKWATLQTTGTWTGTLTIQGSNDNTNFSAIVSQDITTGTAVTTITTNTIIGIILQYRYLRVRMTAYTSGTATGTLELYTAPPPTLVTKMIQSGAWTVGSNSPTGSAVPANAFYMGGLGASGNLAGFGLAGAIGDASGNNTATAAAYVYNGSNWDRAREVAADGQAATGIAAAGHINFNAFNYDRNYNNTEFTILSSAARTTTNSSGDQTNFNWRGIVITLNVSLVGTGSITLKIEGKDSTSGNYYTVLAGAAVTSNSTNVYKVYPGITATANVSASDLVPRIWRITVTHNNANTITYSVGFVGIV